MELQEVFDLLLAQREVSLHFSQEAAHNHLESLRVSLVRKFGDYKKQMDSVGYLSDELAASVLSLEYSKDTGAATFYIREKKRKPIQYTLLISNDEVKYTTPESSDHGA